MQVLERLESFVRQLGGGPGKTVEHCPTCDARMSACLICRDCGYDANWDKWGLFLKTLKHLPKKEHSRALRRLKPEERAHVDALIREAYMEWAREARADQPEDEAVEEKLETESTSESADGAEAPEAEADAAEADAAEPSAPDDTATEAAEEVPTVMPWGDDPDDFEREEPRKRFEAFTEPVDEPSPWTTEQTEQPMDPVSVGFAPASHPEEEFELNPWAQETSDPPAFPVEQELEGPRPVKRCPFCDTEVRPTDPVCQHCGQDLVDE